MKKETKLGNSGAQKTPNTPGSVAKGQTRNEHRILMSLTLPVVIALTATTSSAQSSNVSVNGQVLSVVELLELQKSIGYIAPGNYLYDPNTSCWSNLSTGASGCLNNASGGYISRYGSGHSNATDWNHYSNPAGTGVGGTSDGCVYTTTGWSNC
jgi:hypothetical protein